MPDEPPALAHVERTLAEAYRKQIDQQENVWRTLPFFAATLALQLAALFQMIDTLPDPVTAPGKAALGLLCLIGFLTVAALGLLAASIYPVRYEYIAEGPKLLSYTEALLAAERQSQDGTLAVITLKTSLADQYARSLEHNSRITNRRERWRALAGLAALASVLLTVLLVASAYAHYLGQRTAKDGARVGPARLEPAEAAAAIFHVGPLWPADRHPRSAAAADARGDERLVGAARGREDA